MDFCLHPQILSLEKENYFPLPQLSMRPLKITPLDAVSFPSESEPMFQGEFQDGDNLLSDLDDWPSPGDDTPELTEEQPDQDSTEIDLTNENAVSKPPKNDAEFVEGQ